LENLHISNPSKKAYIFRAKAFRTWEQIDVLISGGLALMIRRSITQWTSGVSLWWNVFWWL